MPTLKVGTYFDGDLTTIDNAPSHDRQEVGARRNADSKSRQQRDASRPLAFRTSRDRLTDVRGAVRRAALWAYSPPRRRRRRIRPMSNKQAIIDTILKHRVSAILRTSDTQLASDAMRAVVTAGFRMIEFTLTIPNAFKLIAEFSRDDSIIVGAGTVLTPDDARRAVDAGAKFLVSPITDADVIAEANRLDVVSIPGTVTPTEMVTAHRMGADFLKFFPAQGDVAGYVRSILGPLPHLRIFPTSGVTEQNFADILKAGAAGVGFVGSLFEPKDMESRNLYELEERAKRILATLGDLRTE